jgi:cytolysin (calcineurin-like family phosphatase)
MKPIVPKAISISIFKLVLPLFVLLFIQVAVNAQTDTVEEQNCFNMVQNKVAWNKAGSNFWIDTNVRALCKGTTNPATTISCFQNIVNQFDDYGRGIKECSALVSNSQSTNLGGNWDGYYPANIKTAYVWRISQTGSSLAFTDVGAGTNTRFSGTMQGNVITDSNNVTGTLSAAGNQIIWSNGVVWKKQVPRVRPTAAFLMDATGTNSASNEFYMIVASDPQYPRMYKDGTQEEDANQPTRSKEVNETQVANIKALIEQLGSDKVKGIIINGDLTEYGHASELETYKEIWSKEKLGSALIYPGLGNHDYVNNLGGCTPDCTNRMLGYMKDLLENKEVNASSYDPNSLAYSWDVGKVHFIQLHLHPARAVNTGTHNIKPSMNWFEEDLKKARTAGKVVIVNMHDYGDSFQANSQNQFTEFKNLLRKYKVSAVFAGHLHRSLGEIETVGNTKIFRSGSPIHKAYLLVHFKDNKVKVESVSSATTTPNRFDTVEFDADTSNQADNSISIPDRSGTATYKVKIVTGNSPGAGTDTNVYISFTGTKAQSSEYLLDDSKNNFEKGDIDEFTLNGVEDVGDLKGFTIRSDLSNQGDDWELKSVQINKGDKFYSQTVTKLVDDGGKHQYFSVTPTTQKHYTVTLKTADVADAGTDSNISFKICGSSQCTDTILLNPQLSGNRLERNHTDRVTFTDIDVGPIAKIEIQSDHAYAGADWNLESVMIQSWNETVNFPVNYNFADKTARSFTPGEAKADYSLAIRTADKSGAGTDSNIYLQISGQNGKTQEQHLNSKTSATNAFERGDIDNLTFSDKDVGTITSINIRSDTKYSGSDWELEWLIITVKGKQYIFRPRKLFDNANTFTFFPDEIK